MKITEKTLREFVRYYLKETEEKRKNLLLEQGLGVWARLRIGGGTYYGRGVVKNGWLGNAIRTANPAISEIMRRAGRATGFVRGTLPATYYQNAQRALRTRTTYMIDLNDRVIARIRRDWLNYQSSRYPSLNDYDIRLAAHRAAGEVEEAASLKGQWEDAQNEFLSKWFDSKMWSNPGTRGAGGPPSSDVPGMFLPKKLPPPDAARRGREMADPAGGAPIQPEQGTVVRIPGMGSGEDAFLYRDRPAVRTLPAGGTREVPVELEKRSKVVGIGGYALAASEITRWITGQSAIEAGANMIYAFGSRDGSPWNNVEILRACLFSSFYNQVVSIRRDPTWNRETLGVFKVEGYQVKQQGQGTNASNDLSGASWASGLIRAIRDGAAGSVGDMDMFEGEESRAIREGFLPVITSGDYSIFDIAAVINSSDLTRKEKMGFMSAYRNMIGRARQMGSAIVRTATSSGEERDDEWWAAQAAEVSRSDVNPYEVIDEFCKRIKGDVVVKAGISNDFSEEFTVGSEDGPRNVNLAKAMLKSESMLFWVAAAFEDGLLIACDPDAGGSPEACRALADEAEELEGRYEDAGVGGVELLPISDEVFEAIFPVENMEGFTGPPTPSIDILDCAAGDSEACKRAGIGPQEAGEEVAAAEEPSVLDRVQASRDMNLLFLDNDFDHDRTSILGSKSSDALSQIATAAQHRPARLGPGFADAMRRVLDKNFDTWWSSWTSDPGFDDFDSFHREIFEESGSGLWANTEAEKKEIYRDFLIGRMGSNNPRTPLGGVFELGPPRDSSNYNSVALGEIMSSQGYEVQGSSSMGDYFYPTLKEWLFDKWGLQGSSEVE